MSSKSAVLIPSATSASVSRAAPRATVLGPLAGIKRVLEESSLLPRPEAAEVPLAHLAGLVQTPALAPLDTVATLLAILLATMVVKTKVLRRGSRLAPLAPSLWLVALSISNPDLSRSRIPQNAISTRLCDVECAGFSKKRLVFCLLATLVRFPRFGQHKETKVDTSSVTLAGVAVVSFAPSRTAPFLGGHPPCAGPPWAPCPPRRASRARIAQRKLPAWPPCGHT